MHRRGPSRGRCPSACGGNTPWVLKLAERVQFAQSDSATVKRSPTWQGGTRLDAGHHAAVAHQMICNDGGCCIALVASETERKAFLAGCGIMLDQSRGLTLQCTGRNKFSDLVLWRNSKM